MEGGYIIFAGGKTFEQANGQVYLHKDTAVSDLKKLQEQNPDKSFYLFQCVEYHPMSEED